ncbi:HdeD family acid-resistance protein [Streptomyces sp. NPDC091272]|uniref:HdeD family acid-resistance protein n=1 Tax=Streptomyces sp. NPDC091272 TaxID=3365981 RepID=UPI00381F08F6
MSTDQSPTPPPTGATPGPTSPPPGATPGPTPPPPGAAPGPGQAPQWGPRPEEGPLHRLGRGAWQAVLAAGLAAVVLGVLVLAWPGRTLVVVAVLFGLYLLVSGVMQLVGAFGTHVSTPLRVMAFISGALSVLLGLFCFRGAMQSLLLLALWIGIGWLFRGITQTVAAISDPAMPARGWQVLLGLVSVLGGIVLIVSPLDSIAVLTVIGGCWLLAVGLVEIVVAFRIRHRAHRVPRDA